MVLWYIAASRADEKQLPASTEQVRERRAGVGGRGGGGRAARQEGRAAAEGHALVGPHGRAARPAARAAALRHGAAPRRAAARRVTSPARPVETISRLHSIIGTVGLAAVHARPGVL